MGKIVVMLTFVVVIVPLAWCDEILITIPKLTIPVQIDGKLTEEEGWNDATKITGFVSLENHLLAQMQTHVYLGYDENALYFAFECEAPQKPIARLRERDSEVWEDDSFEIFIDPKLTRKRHFQFIINAVGSIWDSINKDGSWNGEWKFAVYTKQFGWSGEVAIPFASLGLKVPEEGEVWGFNVCRNAVAGGKELSTFAKVVDTFHDTANFALLKFAGEKNSFQLISLGSPFDGVLQLSLEANSTVDVFMKVKVDNKEFEREFKLNGLKKTDAFIISQNAKWKLALKALSKAGDELIAIAFDGERKAPIELKLTKRLLTAQAIDVSAKFVRLASKVKRAVADLSDSEGKKVSESELELSADGTQAHKTISVEGLRAGKYRLAVRLLNEVGELASDSTEFSIPTRPEWLGSKAGITEEVLPPWKPIKAVQTKDKKWWVNVLLRQYRLNEFGLLDAIIANGKQFLTAPVHFEIIADGKPIKLKGQLKLIESKPSRCTFQSKAIGDGVIIINQTAIEYDGMIRCDFSLMGQLERIDKLAFVIPVKRENARYLHYWPGRWGSCENSFELKEDFSIAFKPIIFIADDDRGIIWFCESDEGFNLKEPARAIQVSVGEKEAVLRINVFDHKPEVADGKHVQFTFGLQASPIKNVPVAWWLKERIAHWGYYGMEKAKATLSSELRYPAIGNIDAMHGTLEAWVKVEFDTDVAVDPKDPSRGVHNRNFFTLRNLKGGDHCAFYWNIDDRGMRFYARVGETYPIVLGARSDMKKGQWHHIAFSWGDEIRIYVDGKLTCKGAFKGLFGKEVNLEGAEIVIGGGRGEWVIDEIKISKSVRTQFDLTKPLQIDDETLLLDRFEHPDISAQTRPQKGKPAKVHGCTQFTEGKFGKGLRIYRDRLFLDVAKELGVRTIVFHEHWTDIQNYTETTHEEKLRSLVKALHNRNMRLAVYFGYEMSNIAPEWEHYSDECLVKGTGGQLVGGYRRQPTQTAYIVCYNSPWQDFLADGIAHILRKYNVDGVYLDGTIVPHGCANTAHGCGYISKEGKLRPTYPIFAVRNLMKRIYTICLKHRPKEPFINAHQSTYLGAPTIAFSTSYWGGEQFAPLKHGQKPPLDILPLGSFRCEFAGRNIGVPADFLVYERSPFTYEEGLAISLLHDVFPRPPNLERVIQWANPIWKAFEQFGVEKSEWIPYWRSQNFVQAQPETVFVSLYLRKGKGALLVIANLDEKEVESKLKINAKAIGLKRKVKLRDEITNESLSQVDGTITLSLAPFWIRLILVSQ